MIPPTPGTTGMSKKNRVPGFTLIELCVVMFIMALFSALLTIRLEGVLSGGDLRLAARMVIGEITRLRGVAAYTHRIQELGFNIEKNNFYTIDPGQPDGRKVSGWPPEKKNAFTKIIKLPGGVKLEDVVIVSTGKIQGGEGRIRFYANGSVDRSLIHLRNENNEVYTLEITPPTGQVTIHDKYIDQRMAP